MRVHGPLGCVHVQPVPPIAVAVSPDGTVSVTVTVPTASGIPLGRQGTSDEIAATCLFLVTDNSGFITGETIHADGGVAAY
jgi:3-oxoacyl-[acyl-carrier protein] reductase